MTEFATISIGATSRGEILKKARGIYNPLMSSFSSTSANVCAGLALAFSAFGSLFTAFSATFLSILSSFTAFTSTSAWGSRINGHAVTQTGICTNALSKAIFLTASCVLEVALLNNAPDASL